MPSKAFLFPSGNVVATPGALDALTESQQAASTFLERHMTGDWGTLDAENLDANDQALIDGTRIVSAYKLPSGKKILIITEADRSSTCMMLPEEY